MQQFDYTITDELGIHVRPAGLLAKLCKEYKSTVTVSVNDKSAEATRLVSLMGLGIAKGDTVTVTIEGDDEDECSKKVNDFFVENL